MTTRVEEGKPTPMSQGQIWRDNLAHFARRNGLQLGIIGVLLAMWIFFILFAPKTFLAPDIYRAFMTSVPFYGIMAMPLTLVIVAREMDLSFPSTMAVGVTAFLGILNVTGSALLALVACLAVGFLIGLLNGIIVVKLGIPSLIATIGTMFFWRGFVVVVNNGKGASLVAVKETPLLREILVGRVAAYFPAQLIWMILIMVAMWILLNRHKFGAHIYLIGDNENSARLMGVNADQTRLLVFALLGLVAAFAGALASLEVSYFFPSLGEGFLMPTLASVFLGGTSVFGGTGTLLGTFVGCFIIGAIEPGIVAIGLTGFWTELIYGLIIVVSVAMHTILRKRIR